MTAISVKILRAVYIRAMFKERKHLPDEAAQFHRHAAEMLRAGFAESRIRNELVKTGLSDDYAAQVIENVHTDNNTKKNFNKMLVVGIFITTGGLVLNFYASAFSLWRGGLITVVFWGIVVSGIVTLIQAAGLYKNLPRY